MNWGTIALCVLALCGVCLVTLILAHVLNQSVRDAERTEHDSEMLALARQQVAIELARQKVNAGTQGELQSFMGQLQTLYEEMGKAPAVPPGAVVLVPLARPDTGPEKH